MFALHEKYIVDDSGKKTGVILSLNEWKKVQEILEEYDDIRAYDEVKSHPSEPVKWKKARKELKK